MIAPRYRVALPAFFLIVSATFSNAAAPDKPGDQVSMGSICSGLPTFMRPIANTGRAEQPDTKKYPVLVFTEHIEPKSDDDLKKDREKNPKAAAYTKHLALYWKAGGVPIDGAGAFTALSPKSFTPISYTTEPLIILTCHFGSANSPSPLATEVDVTATDSEVLTEAEKVAILPFDGTVPVTPVKPKKPAERFDKIFINTAKVNSVSYIYFYASSIGNPDGTVEIDSTDPGKPAPAPSAGLADVTKTLNFATALVMAAKAPAGGGEAPAPVKGDDPPPATPVVAWAVIERHRVVHFSIGSGVVGFHGRSQGFSSITVPTTVGTQTCIGKLSTLQTSASPIVGTTGSTGASAPTNGYSYDPCSVALPILTLGTNTSLTSYESNVTTATAAGTANYALATPGQPYQIGAVAGLTVYPFGHDTFGPSIGRGLSASYGWKHPLSSVGIFAGTSINTFGNFTTGLTYEIFPGVQAMMGNTFWSKTVLAPDLTACTGYGTSPSYSLAPASSQSDATLTYTPASTAAGGTPTTNTITISQTRQTVTTSATSGCVNGNAATILSGTTITTSSVYKPAFSFGIIFNSNLSRAFSGIFK